MLKKLLKTSVSALVLLGALSSLNPSHGMEEKGNKSNGQNKRKTDDSFDFNNKKTKKEYPIEWILTPLEDHKKRALETLNFEKLENDGDFSSLSKTVKQYLVKIFLDFKSIMNLELACKRWYLLINKDKEILQKKWDFQINSPNFFYKLLANQHNAPFVLEKLALLFPYKALNLRRDKNTEIMVEEPSNDQNKLLSNLIQAIKNSPESHAFLCRMAMSLSPFKNFQEAGLLARIIKKVPDLQEILEEILNKTTFEMDECFGILKSFEPTYEPDESVDILKSSEPTQSCLQHLRALKLLALSGNKKAKERMLEFITRCENEDSSSLVGLVELGGRFQFLFSPSFSDDPKLLGDAIRVFQDFFNSREQKDLLLQRYMDLEQLRTIVKYIFSIQPQLKEEYERIFYDNIKDISSFQKKKMHL